MLNAVALFGRVEIKQLRRFENNRLVVYSYSITFDSAGKETGRTKPTPLGSLGWSDGTPFTKQDLKDLEN